MLKLEFMQLKNFGCFESLGIAFNNHTQIVGKNGSGKSTIKNAYAWCLGKNSAISAIPVVDGELNYCKMPMVEIRFADENAGKKIFFKREMISKEKNGVIQTSSNYFINDIPMKEKDYFAALANDYGMSSIVLDFVTAPESFFCTKVSERQSALAFLVRDEVNFSDFSSCQKRFDNSKKLEKIIAKNVEQLQASIVPNEDVDTLKAEIEKVTRETVLNTEEKQKQDALQSIENRLNDMTVKAKKTRNHIEEIVNEKELCLSNIRRFSREISEIESEQKTLKSNYAELKTKTFGVTEEFCPVCGQKFTESNLAAKMDIFEKNKTSKLREYLAQGNENKKRLSELMNCVSENQIKVKNYEDAYKVAQEELAKIEDEIKGLNEEKGSIHFIDFDKPKTDVQSLIARLNVAEAMSKRNAEINKEIESEREKYVQTVADIEKTEAELNEFVKSIEAVINGKFKIVKWKMYKKNQRGEYELVCMPLVGGVDFNLSLNNGAKLNALVDGYNTIVCGKVPMFVDNAESVSDWLLEPNGQLILLKVDDCNMVVK